MKIREWLDGPRDYNMGKMLYAMVPYHNSNILRNLNRIQSSFTEEQLAYELGKYAVPRIHKKETALPPATTVTATASAPKRKEYAGFPVDAPDEVQAIIERCKDHYRNADDYHARMREEMEPAKRYELAKLVLYHRGEVDKCWRIIDAYKNYGTIPYAAAAEKELTPVDAHKLLTGSVRPKITRYRQRLEKSPDDTKLAAQLEEQEALAARLKQIIES